MTLYGKDSSTSVEIPAFYSLQQQDDEQSLSNNFQEVPLSHYDTLLEKVIDLKPITVKNLLFDDSEPDDNIVTRHFPKNLKAKTIDLPSNNRKKLKIIKRSGKKKRCKKNKIYINWHKNHLEKQKNILPITRINKLQKIYQSGNYRGRFISENFQILKKLEILHLAPIVTGINNLNPMKGVRILDYFFPLDSSFTSNQENGGQETPLFLDLPKYKRIIKIIKEPNLDIFTYFVEEKFPIDREINQNTTNYFIEWQESLGDSEAHQLAVRNFFLIKIKYKEIPTYIYTKNAKLNGQNYDRRTANKF